MPACTLAATTSPGATLAIVAPPAPSDRPLASALAALMTERRLSYRALSQRTRSADPAGTGLTHGHLANLIAGRARPSRRALELIARALELEPDHFAEYRLAELRDQLDERRVGFDAAYRRYHTLTRAA
jgi:transcriptional regulator with XRE-family HTH domain